MPTAGENIVITSGAQQATWLITQLLIGPVDEVVVEEPTSRRTLDVLKWACARLLSVPLTDTGLRLDLLGQLIARRRPRTIYCQPVVHDPTGGDNGPASHAGVCPNPRSPQPFLRRGHLVSGAVIRRAASPSRARDALADGPATRGEHAVEADLGWSAGRTGLWVDTGSDAASIGGALRARGVRALTGPEHFSPFGGMDSYLSLPLWYPGDELERALEDLGDITRSA